MGTRQRPGWYRASQEAQGRRKVEEARNRLSLEPQQSTALPTACLWTFGLQAHERIHLCQFKLLAFQLFLGDPGTRVACGASHTEELVGGTGVGAGGAGVPFDTWPPELTQP